MATGVYNYGVSHQLPNVHVYLHRVAIYEYNDWKLIGSVFIKNVNDFYSFYVNLSSISYSNCLRV